MTTTAAPARRRVFAFARRAWIQQGTITVWLAALVGGLFGVLVFLGTGGVNTLTSMPDLIPSDPAGLVAVSDWSGEFLPMTSYLLLMTPVILGMLVAIVATLTLPGVVADDITGGGIEALLAGPIPRRSLFTAYLGAALVSGGLFVAEAHRLMAAAKRGAEQSVLKPMRPFHFSITYVTLLFLGVALDPLLHLPLPGLA